MSEPIGKYMVAKQDGTFAGKKTTKRWVVFNARDDGFLGEVKWYSSWRQYVFFPTGQRTLFSAGCLRDMARFIDGKTRGHKGEKADGYETGARLVDGDHACGKCGLIHPAPSAAQIRGFIENRAAGSIVTICGCGWGTAWLDEDGQPVIAVQQEAAT